MTSGRNRQAGPRGRASATSNGPGQPVRINQIPAPAISPRHHDYFCFEWESHGRTVTHVAGGPDRRVARGR